MSKAPAVHRTTHRINFSDLDPYKHMRTAMYPAYYIDHRMAALREQAGWDLATLESLPFMTFVRKLEVEFLRPVVGDQEIAISSFVREFVEAHEMLFAVDKDEFDTFKEQSASMRRVFSRRKSIIPLIGRDGGFFKVLPKSGRIVPADPAKFPKHGPYRSPRAFAKAVKEAQAAAEDKIVEFVPDIAV